MPSEAATTTLCNPLESASYDVPFPNPIIGKRSFIDLFAGIGGIRIPFTELGYKCVFSSELDKNAQRTYFANFGEHPYGDITKEITKQQIPEHFDLLLAGFPCQAFSIMGKMKGFADTRGTLFSMWQRYWSDINPKQFCLRM